MNSLALVKKKCKTQNIKLRAKQTIICRNYPYVCVHTTMYNGGTQSGIQLIIFPSYLPDNHHSLDVVFHRGQVGR